jgi:hypothetical protein
MFLSGKLSLLNFLNPFYIVFQIFYVNKFETNLMYIEYPKTLLKECNWCFCYLIKKNAL